MKMSLDVPIAPLKVPERGLIAAILLQAHSDCYAGGEEGRRAYQWIVRMRPAFRFYCGLLDIDPEKLRARIVLQFAEFGEKKQRRRRKATKATEQPAA